MNLASKMPEKVSGFASRLQDQATIAAKQLPDKASSVATKLQTQANCKMHPQSRLVIDVPNIYCRSVEGPDNLQCQSSQRAY